ncbi:FAD-dependent oxidoreductase [Candidatus Azambacteria bacterium]|nr:FAD-dependent oxidoreductase [Candidatus Azambacteria bacterium]
MYDVLVVGSGIASFSAAMFAAKKKVMVQVIADAIGGQAARQWDMYSYPGYLGKDGDPRTKRAEQSSYDGAQLVQNIRKQAEELGVAVAEAEGGIQKISFRQEHNHEIFILEDAGGNVYEGNTVIIASGKKPRKLGVPGEDEFIGKGVSYGMEESAQAFEGKSVAVVGAGNAGLDVALALSKYAKKLSIVEVGDRAGGDKSTQEKLAQSKNVVYILNAAVQKIIGNEWVGGVEYISKTTGETNQLEVDQVFVTTGMNPNSDFLRGFCEVNQSGEVVINPRTNATSHVGVFAAGDVTDIPEKEAIIAAGEGAKAALQCVKWLVDR